MNKLLDLLNTRFTAPPLTRTRMGLALLIALVADALQILLAVPPVPEIVDGIAAVFAVWLLGFHLLLLPTFLVELIPAVDMLPTWTGCVVAVIALRKRAQSAAPPVQPQAPAGQTPLPEKITRRTDLDI